MRAVIDRELSTLTLAAHVPAPTELDYVAEVLRSGRTEGDGTFTARASEHLRRMHLGAPVLLTTSCTDALELAALAIGVNAQFEVVVPSFTFTSTANAFALRGARIRFADVDPNTWSMGLREATAAITPKTRIVVAVHYGGVGPEIDQLRAACDVRGILLVEDNAQGLFGAWHGRPLGTFGTLSTLSFHRTKNVSCGEGGALVVNAPELLGPIEILREKGTDRARFLRGEVDKYTWRAVGSSFLPSDILAAVLMAQLEDSTPRQARRHAIWGAYHAMLLPRVDRLGITLQSIPPGAAHPAHLFALLLPRTVERARVIELLRADGIMAVSHYEPLHLSPVGSKATVRLPVTEDIAPRLLRLPLSTTMTVDDAARVVDRLEHAITAAGRAR